MKPNLCKLSSQSGQATVEYLVIAIGVLIAVATLDVAGRAYCINGFRGNLTADACRSLPSLFESLLRRTVEDMTFLINLPF